MSISSLHVSIAHALIGHEHFATTPRQVAVPQSHNLADPSREHAAKVQFKYDSVHHVGIVNTIVLVPKSGVSESMHF